MNVTKNQIDELNVELTIEIAPEDYAEIERKKLAECRRNAEFKGFRKGMAPAALIKKVYGDRALADAVNEVLGQSLDSAIKDNSLDILGEPLSSEKQPEVTWVSGEPFTFVFDLGLRPQISIDVTSDDSVTKYSITPGAETITKMTENLKKYNEEQKKEATDEEVAAEVDANLKSSLENEAEYQFSKDIRRTLVEKAAVKLPEEFLKRWLLSANKDKVTPEQVDKEFPAFIEDFKWQLVRGYLMQKWGFKVTDQDLFDAAEGYVRYQYAMYGLGNVPDDMVQDAAHRILQDGRQVGNLHESVEDQKVLSKVKEIITVGTQEISEEDFRSIK